MSPGYPGVLRVEDERFITGRAHYVDDIEMPGTAHAVFVRSPVPHARITSIDVASARSVRGVSGIFVAEDLGLPAHSFGDMPRTLARPMLAENVVRFIGEAVAVVVADTRAQAMDGAEEIFVDYDPLEMVIDPLRALEEDAPLLFPEHGSNAVHRKSITAEGDVLAGSEVTAGIRLTNQRVAPVPLETNAVLAQPSDDRLTMWISCQGPLSTRDDIASALGIEGNEVRVIASTVGGAFGSKIFTYPEHIVIAAIARRMGRPVKFVETRTESMVAMTHGRGQHQEVEIGARADGTLTGLRARAVVEAGAYALAGAILVDNTANQLSGPYRIPAIDFDAQAVVTNTTPTNPYRGAGQPEAAALLERAIDVLAMRLNIDPVEIRKRNFLTKEEFPYDSRTGAKYDSGDYIAALTKATELVSYDDVRRQQRIRREDGRAKQLGIGVGCYVNCTGFGCETAPIEIHPEGTATIVTGVSPHGQGLETALAHIAATELHIPIMGFEVIHSDTDAVLRGDGTMGSRSLERAGSAVLHSARALVSKARTLAAHLLEASVEDIEVSEDGRVGIAGAPASAMTWAELARAASEISSLPDGMEPGLSAEEEFDNDDPVCSFGTHIAVVEVDTQTGRVEMLRHVAVDDCGFIINPITVAGQVHGGIAQGIGQALFEQVVYDTDGNPLTSSLALYGFPTAVELPAFETAHTETPSPNNPLGAKGIGEGPTTGSTPAVHNAVIDAVAHLGVRHIDMPLLPERVWRAIQDASRTGSVPV